LPSCPGLRPFRRFAYHLLIVNGERDAWGKVGRITGFGLTAGIAMLLCGALGLFIDRRLGTTPVFTAVLFLAGGGTALWYGMVRLLK